MGQVIFRCVLVVTLLILIFGFGTKGFSYALTDAYNTLIGNGWTVQDALGFLGTSVAGTLAMNPSLAPAAVAGALSAYIVYKGAQLYDIYRDWRNLRTGIAVLNPVEYSQSLSVKQVVNGGYGWSEIWVRFYFGQTLWYFNSGYTEKLNNNGSLVTYSYSSGDFWGRTDQVMNRLNSFVSNIQQNGKDAEGVSMFTAVMGTASNYVLAGTAYNVTYTREIVPAFVGGSTGVNAITLGYRVNVDPASISGEGVNYLSDPDAFYNWFVSNYMNGVNEGSFVTPLNDAYDEIRSQLETIINQLNTLSGGGVSEEVLNQLKTDIINTITNSLNTQVEGLNTKVDGLNTKVDNVNTKVGGLDTKLDGVNTKVDDVNTKVDDVVSTIDTLTTDINEAQEQEQGFWDRLMEWLDVTLFEKLQALLEDLFLPTQEQLDELLDIQLPEYQKSFAADISISSQTGSIPISLYGASVDLSGYISQYASGLRQFMNIFVSGLAAFFVIRAFRVHLNID